MLDVKIVSTRAFLVYSPMQMYVFYFHTHPQLSADLFADGLSSLISSAKIKQP